METVLKRRLWRWNSTVPDAIERCVHAVLEERSRTRPDAQAVCAWDRTLTYAELDTLATRLSWHLRDLGVGPEVLVPLLFEKSAWTVVAMIAVLKAGGAFVPLDPTQGVERRKQLLAQTGGSVVLTSERYKTLPLAPGYTVVSVSDSAINNLPNATPKRIQSDYSPTSAAYVIFTSGSSGQPKGVLVEHRAVSSSCYYHGRLVGMCEESRVLQFASYTFDACILEVITTLIHGGSVCVPSDEQRLSNIGEAMSGMEVNMAFLTPSVARLLSPDQCPTLRTVLLGGEACFASDLERWGNRRIFNCYGPTECTVFCSIDAFTQHPPGQSCIGMAVGSVSWVVNPQDHHVLAPMGTVGELLVEGPILARGYVGDDERTAAAFIEDPPWLLEGPPEGSGRRGRLYKTGDLVRYNEDGSLVYVGRKDSQIKIRGQRVELGEVEYHVRQCMPQARHVVAEMIIPAGDGSDPLLAAFLVLGDGTEMDMEADAQVVPVSTAVDNQLAECLPGYMMPTVYLAIPQMPIGSTGKINRRRLREIGASFTAQQLVQQSSSQGAGKRMPSTETEQTLQQIWARVLNLDPASIGADDSFFRLGGNSMKAVKVASYARKAGIKFTVSDMFRQLTLGNLAHSIDNVSESDLVLYPSHGWKTQSNKAHLLLPGSPLFQSDLIEDIYPCTPLQEGLLALNSQHTNEYVIQGVLELSAETDLSLFQQAWEQTVEKLAILRTRIVQGSESKLLQVVLKEKIEWLYANDLERYLEVDRTDEMGLGTPLSRWALVQNEIDSHFVWTIHHALFDGVSLPLIFRLVGDTYYGRSTSNLSNFKTFVNYLSETNNYEERRTYWEKTFADYDSEAFPLLPFNVLEPVANCSLECQFATPRLKGSDITTATLLRAGWAVVTVTDYCCMLWSSHFGTFSCL